MSKAPGAFAVLKNSPAVLKTAYETHPNGQVSALLKRLLSDPKMEGAWRELAK